MVIRNLVALLLLGVASLSSAADHPAAGKALPRIDAPLTAENSVLFDFGYGKIARVPKILFSPELIPANPKMPIKAPTIWMTFLFPDMTMHGGTSDMDKIFLKSRNQYVPQVDHFVVRILWLGYAPTNTAGLPPGTPPTGPSPAEVERNRNCQASYAEPCTMQMQRLESGIANIDKQVDSKRFAAHPELARKPLSEGGSFISKPDSPYELSMSCHSVKGVQCIAFVYSRRHQFQYRAIFPPEALPHSNELFLAIEKLLAAWTSQ